MEEDEKFRLLDLPPELRNRIYCLVLVKGSEISIQTKIKQIEESEACALLRTCRQVYREAVSTYYSFNIFKLYHTSNFFPQLRGWFQSIGEENLRQIQFMRLQGSIHRVEDCASHCHVHVNFDFREPSADVWYTTACCGRYVLTMNDPMVNAFYYFDEVDLTLDGSRSLGELAMEISTTARCALDGHFVETEAQQEDESA